MKTRFARQKVTVKPKHYWQLAYVRTSFAQFKRAIRALEEAEDREIGRAQQAVEMAGRI